MTQVPPNKLKFKEHLEWDKKGMDLNLFLRKYEKSDDLKNKSSSSVYLSLFKALLTADCDKFSLSAAFVIVFSL